MEGVFVAFLHPDRCILCHSKQMEGVFLAFLHPDRCILCHSKQMEGVFLAFPDRCIFNHC